MTPVKQDAFLANIANHTATPANLRQETITSNQLAPIAVSPFVLMATMETLPITSARTAFITPWEAAVS